MTGSVYINDNIVYGVNTTFTTRFNPGDNIVVGGQRYKVLKVIGDTSMLVDSSILAPINKTNGATLSNAQSKFGTNSLSLNGSSTMTISNLGKKKNYLLKHLLWKHGSIQFLHQEYLCQ